MSNTDTPKVVTRSNIRNTTIDIDLNSLKEAKNFSNYTTKDLLLIYLNGDYEISRGKHKPFSNVIVQQSGDTIILDYSNDAEPECVKQYKKVVNTQFEKQMNEMSGGYSEALDCFYYGPDDDHYGGYNMIPKLGCPTVIKSSMSFVLLLFNDKESIERALSDIKKAGGCKQYAESMLLDDINDISVGVRYINLSPYPLFYASYEKRSVEILHPISLEEGKRLILKHFMDYDPLNNYIYEYQDDDYIFVMIIDGKSKRVCKFEKEENCTFVSKNLQYVNPDKRQEIIPLFYNEYNARIYLEEYKANPCNLYIDAALSIADEEIEEEIYNEQITSRRNMIAVGKVCAAMVTSGLLYGAGRVIVEKIIESRNKTNKIMRMVQIAKCLMNAGVSQAKCLASLKSIGVLSKFISPMAMGTTIAVSVLNPVVLGTIITVGCLAVIVGICAIFKDSIEEFLDDHPLLGIAYDAVKGIGEAIVEGVKTVASKVVEGIQWIGEKIWDGMCAIGDWFSDIFCFC